MASPARDSSFELEGLVGSVVAEKYRVDRLIGRGGMGAVFQATNVAIGKRVALKFLDADVARDTDAAVRFQREAQAASLVESAHIVQIFDAGRTSDEIPFLVMELLSGEDLRARLKREGRLSPATVRRIGAQVLKALVSAHAAGIVHRDLKPDNVFLCRRDDDPEFVKIVDFGISKLARTASVDTLTQKGTVLGTAYYMSPEQAQSFPDIDGRTDLFSLGAIMYEALAGRPPHTAPTYEAVLIGICTRDPAPLSEVAPDVPEALAAIVHRALERDRDKRFENAAEFLRALESLELEPVRSPSAATTRKEARPGARTSTLRTVVAGTVAAALGFALTAVLVSRSRSEPRAEPPLAVPLASIEAPAVASAVTTAVPSETPRVESPPAPSASSTPEVRVKTPRPAAASSVRKPAKAEPPKPKTETGVGRGLSLSTDMP